VRRSPPQQPSPRGHGGTAVLGRPSYVDELGRVEAFGADPRAKVARHFSQHDLKGRIVKHAGDSKSARAAFGDLASLWERMSGRFFSSELLPGKALTIVGRTDPRSAAGALDEGLSGSR
jgi:hypothetical protein